MSLTLSLWYDLQVSHETVRLQLHAAGYEWKRAKLKAKDDDPQRVVKLAQIRLRFEQLGKEEAFFWSDELDIALLAKVGAQWTLKGTQVEVATPGKNEKHYLAGALNGRTRERIRVTGSGKHNGLFRALLEEIESRCGPQIKKIYVVVDNYKIHKAKAVVAWLEKHRRIELLWLPTYCPKANPIERVFWDVHDKCTRNHQRKRLRDLVGDVEEYFPNSEGWLGELPGIYYEPEVTKMVKRLSKSEERLVA